jgi:hypothetical protein
LATTTTPTPRQSTRVAAKIRLTVSSLNPSLSFSETCDTVSVNSFGCAMHAPKEIAVGTPVLLKMQSGKEATGQVAFCKASTANDKWGIGIELDSPGNFWELKPCPADWLSASDAIVSSASKPGVKSNGSVRLSGPSAADLDAIRLDLREEMRKEFDSFLKHADRKVAEELKSHKEKTAALELMLKDAAQVRDSLAAALQSFQKNLDQKLAGETEKTFQQIKDQVTPLTEQTRSEAQQLQKDLQKLSGELKKQGQSLWEDFEKGRREFVEITNKHLEDKKQGIAGAAESMAERSEEIYKGLQERLEKQFASKQDAILLSQTAVEAEATRLQLQLQEFDERASKMQQLSSEGIAGFGEQLDKKVLEVRANTERSLEDLQKHQVGMARTEMEGIVTPVAARGDTLVKELLSLVDPMSRERDEIQTQLDALRQEKKEIEIWLASKAEDFRKTLEDGLADGRVRGKSIVQQALDAIQDPIDQFSREAKTKIEENTARQHADLGNGIRSLREELAALQQRTSETVRASVIGPAPVAATEVVSDKVEGESSTEVEKPSHRANSSLAQKLSGLVRGNGKRE